MKILEVVPKSGTKAKLKALLKMLQAFIGYLDRHLGGDIESISVHYW